MPLLKDADENRLTTDALELNFLVVKLEDVVSWAVSQR